MAVRPNTAWRPIHSTPSAARGRLMPAMRASRWLALLTLAFYLFACSPASASPVVINETAVPPVPALDPQRVAQGEKLYVQYCASCHGANLEGQPEWKKPLADGSLPAPPHDDSGHTWHHPDSLLMDITTKGGATVYNDPSVNSKMPAFSDQLTPEEISVVLDFIKSKWSKESREFQWWMTATRDGR